MALPGTKSTRLTATVINAFSAKAPGRIVSAAPFHRFTRTANPKAIATAIHKDGACIIEQFHSPDQVRRFNADIDTAMTRLCPGRPDANGDEFLETFHGSKTKRLWNLCTLSKTWREELINDNVMHAVCDEVIGRKLGDYWLSTAQMIEIGPGSAGQPLHADGAAWWPFWEMARRSGNEMMLNFLVAGTDTTAANGATCVIPGSHEIDYFGLDPADEEEPESWRREADAVPVELAAGDCLLVGGRIVHKGGANTTEDEYRRVLTATVVSSAFTPEEASPLLIGREVAEGMPERVKKFVGFRGMWPTGSIGLWTEHTGDMKGLLGF